jgi:RNA polymerase sigma factor (sigma-70 family)
VSADPEVNASRAAELELARRCAAGEPAAWDRFVLEYRPVLYRAAMALDRTGGARDLADSLFADLYGLKDTGGERQSLLRYFSGRSSLATWLRAVLAQRYVDCLRAQRRLEPLPPDDRAAVEDAIDSGRAGVVELVLQVLTRVVEQLDTKDRLRLTYYYVQDLTLAQVGRLLKEHEATVSRQLARTRRAIRDDVAHELRARSGLTDAQIDECFASVADDPGTLDLRSLLGGGKRDAQAPERSI